MLVYALKVLGFLSLYTGVGLGRQLHPCWDISTHLASTGYPEKLDSVALKDISMRTRRFVNAIWGIFIRRGNPKSYDGTCDNISLISMGRFLRFNLGGDSRIWLVFMLGPNTDGSRRAENIAALGEPHVVASTVTTRWVGGGGGPVIHEWETRQMGAQI